jgi:hypothetical protein
LAGKGDSKVRTQNGEGADGGAFGDAGKAEADERSMMDIYDGADSTEMDIEDLKVAIAERDFRWIIFITIGCHS